MLDLQEINHFSLWTRLFAFFSTFFNRKYIRPGTKHKREERADRRKYLIQFPPPEAASGNYGKHGHMPFEMIFLYICYIKNKNSLHSFQYYNILAGDCSIPIREKPHSLLLCCKVMPTLHH